MKHTLKILSKVPIRKTQYNGQKKKTQYNGQKKKTQYNGQKKKGKKTTMVEKCYTENF